MISYYFTTSNAVTALPDKNTLTVGSYIFIYLVTTCFTILLYVILKVVLKWYNQFRKYHNTIPFYEIHGHNKGPLMTIAIEFSNLSEF